MKRFIDTLLIFVLGFSILSGAAHAQNQTGGYTKRIFEGVYKKLEPEMQRLMPPGLDWIKYCEKIEVNDDRGAFNKREFMPNRAFNWVRWSTDTLHVSREAMDRLRKMPADATETEEAIRAMLLATARATGELVMDAVLYEMDEYWESETEASHSWLYNTEGHINPYCVFGLYVEYVFAKATYGQNGSFREYVQSYAKSPDYRKFVDECLKFYPMEIDPMLAMLSYENAWLRFREVSEKKRKNNGTAYREAAEEKLEELTNMMAKIPITEKARTYIMEKYPLRAEDGKPIRNLEQLGTPSLARMNDLVAEFLTLNERQGMWSKDAGSPGDKEKRAVFIEKLHRELRRALVREYDDLLNLMYQVRDKASADETAPLLGAHYRELENSLVLVNILGHAFNEVNGCFSQDFDIQNKDRKLEQWRNRLAQNNCFGSALLQDTLEKTKLINPLAIGLAIALQGAFTL